ncbi:MAG: glutamate 5-kinase [Actinobacteria bacterium]|nr:glutamate 5-kinase [Actinomycetota bacterium]
MSLSDHRDIPKAKRLVVKVGSSSITGANESNLAKLVAAIAKNIASGQEIVLVTSGAIATGLPLLKLLSKPDDLATSQALAAVGQSRLMLRYQVELDKYDLLAGQVLLSAHDLENEESSANAKEALGRLFDLGVLPIVNENDTVATAEIRFGDNDRLAALVAILVEADALILLSDVDALYDRPPTEAGANKIEWVEPLDDLSSIKIGSSSSNVGTGGAVTKLQAARTATDNGITVLLTSIDNVGSVLSGDRVGTWFRANRD